MKRSIGFFFMAVAAVLLFAAQGQATLVVDQHQDTISSEWWLNMGAFSIGQEFTPQVANLAAVEFASALSFGDTGPGVQVNVRQGSITGTVVGQGAIASSVNGWNLIDLEQDAWLSAGSLYVLEFISSYPNNGVNPVSNNPYSGGRFILDGDAMSNYDLSFRTYYDPAAQAPVPLPGAMWLLGSGLLGLVGVRRCGWQR